jgi:hypothetical protein
MSITLAHWLTPCLWSASGVNSYHGYLPPCDLPLPPGLLKRLSDRREQIFHDRARAPIDFDRYSHAGRQTVPFTARIERSCFQIKRSSKGKRLRTALLLALDIGCEYILSAGSAEAALRIAFRAF